MTATYHNKKTPACALWSDGVCVFLFIKVRNPLLPKIALLIADLFIFSVMILGIVIEIPVLSIISLIFLAMLLWYSLWNFYGEERLIINAGSLSYSHHYGSIKTSYTTIPFNKRLSITVTDEIKGKGEDQLQIGFNSYTAKNNLPAEVYRTSFYIDRSDYHRLIELLDDVMMNEVSDKYNLPDIHLN